MMPCNIEEADESLLLHIPDVSKRFDRGLIKTVDSDVVIIATAAFQKNPVNELWIEFGKGKSIYSMRLYSI